MNISMLQEYVCSVINEAAQKIIHVTTPPGGQELLRNIYKFAQGSDDYKCVTQHRIQYYYDTLIIYDDAILSVADTLFIYFVPDEYLGPNLEMLDDKYAGGLIMEELSGRFVVTFDEAERFVKICKSGQEFAVLMRRLGTKF